MAGVPGTANFGRQVRNEMRWCTKPYGVALELVV